MIYNLIIDDTIEERRKNDESIQFTDDTFLDMWIQAGYTDKYNFGYKDIPIQEISEIIKEVKKNGGDVTNQELVVEMYINLLAIEEDKD